MSMQHEQIRMWRDCYFNHGGPMHPKTYRNAVHDQMVIIILCAKAFGLFFFVE